MPIGYDDLTLYNYCEKYDDLKSVIFKLNSEDENSKMNPQRLFEKFKIRNRFNLY